MRQGIACCLLVGLVAIGCQQEPPQEPGERVVTLADGEPITVADFEASYVRFLMTSGQNDTPANRYLYLNQLVDAELLADEAARQGMGGDSLFEAVVDRARRTAIGGRYFETAFVETLPPLEDAQLRDAYVRSQQQVLVRHLFYRYQDEADQAYARIQAGTSFLEEAMRCYDLPAIDSSAGFLGPIRYFQVDDAFAEAAFALDPGDISPPVRSRFGFHIIKVDDKFGTPIVTESGYQTKREGLANQVALRTRRLEGDRFVRGFMQGLNVQVNAPAIASLTDALADLERRVTPDAGEVELGVETVQLNLGELQQELTPTTPLASYVMDGDTLLFTASDYYFWLPELPFSEARNLTAASVGRALRNQALYRAGLERGLDEDARVIDDVRHARRRELTRRLRDSLRATPPDSIAEADLRTAFVRSPLARQRTYTATFWTIPFATQQEAETAQMTLTGDPSRAAGYPGYTAYTNQPLADVPAWMTTVRQAPVEQVLVARQASGTWALVYVSGRRSEPATSFEVVRDSLERAIAPRYNEYQLLQRLYDEATIATDTLLFEQIMELEE